MRQITLQVDKSYECDVLVCGGDSYSGYRTKGHIGVLPFDVESLKIVLE